MTHWEEFASKKFSCARMLKTLFECVKKTAEMCRGKVCGILNNDEEKSFKVRFSLKFIKEIKDLKLKLSIDENLNYKKNYGIKKFTFWGHWEIFRLNLNENLTKTIQMFWNLSNPAQFPYIFFLLKFKFAAPTAFTAPTTF